MSEVPARWQRLAPVAAVLLVAAAYAGISQAGWLWDDRALVLTNTTLDHPTFQDVFLKDLWAGTGEDPSPYHRPLMTLSLVVDHQLLGGSSALAHLHSLAWHLLCVGLVMRLYAPRLGPVRGAVAGLVFGLHPIQTEAVAWIAARNDLMAAAFLLLTLAVTEAKPRPLLAAVTAALALLSKESAALLPLVYLLWRLAWAEKVRGQDLLGIVVGLGAVLGLRLAAALGDFQDIARIHPDHPFGLPWALVRWLGWCIVPWPLTTTATVYGTPPASAFVGAALAVLSFGLALRARPRRTLGLALLFAATLAPALPTVLGTSMLGERYLYLPLLGLAGLVASVTIDLPTRALGVLTTIGALLAINLRLPDWIDDVSLFGAAARRAPDGFSLWLYGNALNRADHPREAFLAYDTAVSLRPFLPFSCGPLAEASVLLDDESLLARLPRWETVGCRAASGFDDAIFWRLAESGRVDLLLPRLETQRTRDESGRSAVVRGAVRLRDGDWTALMIAATRHAAGPADFLDRAQGVEASWR